METLEPLTLFRKLCGLWLLLLVGLAEGASVQLQWEAPTTNDDGSPLTDLAGYYIYQREPPDEYDVALPLTLPAGTHTAMVGNLVVGQTYAFVVTAYDTSDHESVLSPELVYLVEAQPVPQPVATLAVTWGINSAPPEIPNLVLGYAFDETSGTTAADRSGQHHTGTLKGGATWVTGKYGHALRLNGSTGYVTVAGPTTAAAGSWTFAAWVKRTNEGYLLDVESGRLIISFGQWCQTPGRVCLHDESGTWRMVTPLVREDEWQHLAVVCNATTKQATGYLNGVAGSPVAYTPTPFGGAVVIGGDYEGGSNYGGDLDDLRLYNRALSASEIAAILGSP